jgi:predicted transcriptional regulator
VSTNLRLSEDLAGALRQASARTGRSQQDIVRDALARELGLATGQSGLQRAVAAGIVEAPEPFRDVIPTLTLPAGKSSLDLLERDER